MKISADSLSGRGLSTVPRHDAPVKTAAPVVNVAAPNVTVAAPTVNVAAPEVTVNVPKMAWPVIEVGMVAGPGIDDLAAAMRELKQGRPKGMIMTVERDQAGLITSTHVKFEY